MKWNRLIMALTWLADEGFSEGRVALNGRHGDGWGLARRINGTCDDTLSLEQDASRGSRAKHKGLTVLPSGKKCFCEINSCTSRNCRGSNARRAAREVELQSADGTKMDVAVSITAARELLAFVDIGRKILKARFEGDRY